MFHHAARSLHPRHQLPFVLSRVAASRAIEALASTEEGVDGTSSNRVVFTGDRQSARTLYARQLSMSHEDGIAAAVAWVPDGLSSHSRSRAADTVTLLKENAGPADASHKSANEQLEGRLVCAVDVCPVAEVHRVRCRFPQLGARWLPQCVTLASNDAIHGALCTLAEPSMEELVRTDPNRSSSYAYVDAVAAAALHARRRDWWRHLPRSCTSEAEAYASLVLAQHWGARECAVKLLGISGRSFSYGCLCSGPTTTFTDSCLSVFPFTTSYMSPQTLYRGLIGGTEGEVWRRAGLDPVVHLYAWVEWCPHSDTTDMPYVVVAACCSTHQTPQSLR